MTAPRASAPAQHARVQSLLTDTARDGGDPLAKALFATPQRGLDLLLSHLERCHLPQDATLRFSDGQCVTIEAGNRRFLRLKQARPALTGAAAALCTDTPVRSTDADRVRAGLLDLLQDRTGFELSLVAGQPAHAGSTGGVPARALRTHTPPPVDFEDRVARARGLWGAALRAAFLWKQENMHVVAGSAAAVDALESWSAPVLMRLLDDRFPLAATFETDGAYIISGATEDIGHCLLACHVGTIFAAHVVGLSEELCRQAWDDAGRPPDSAAAFRALDAART